jgi:hypothetical protein
VQEEVVTVNTPAVFSVADAVPPDVDLRLRL